MRTRLLSPCLVAVLLGLVGCGGPDIAPSEQVDVNGTVAFPGVKIPTGVSITFQPTGGKALPAVFPLKADGSFAGKMSVGKYTYYLSFPEGNQKLEAAAKVIPEPARKGSLDRQIDVKGGTLDLAF